MNPDLDRLRPYPFQRLSELLSGAAPPAGLTPIALSIGEPRHPAPSFIAETLSAHLAGLARYPATRGGGDLREATAAWLTRRFDLPAGSIDPARHVLPVNGTREALFAFAQAVVERGRGVRVAMPNPFYQIYEGAALLAGAEPLYLSTGSGTGAVAELAKQPAATLDALQLVYVCSPDNPTGAVLPLDQLTALIELADRHDFIIASDECYSEIYPREDRPPAGLLQACAAVGRHDYRRCVAFQSLSKRSNVPGLRSGFVAGDAQVLERFFLYRTYHGCAMAPPTQAASVAAWQDEAHVVSNRAEYRRKFDAVLEVLGDSLPVQRPDGGFYLWPRTPMDDRAFTRELYARYHVTVLPGSFLSRGRGEHNPGRNRLRMALVAPLDECVEAARRIRRFLAEIETQ
jgi:N-succinyldiaminopimelate aminotransferase